MARVGVLLAGCGFLDGTEIHEAVCTLLFLDRAGAEIVCFAPDSNQHHIINHLNQQEAMGRRNVLEESARIARCEIKPLAQVKEADLDALIIPGGFGAAKNLCDFAFKGAEMTVKPEVDALVNQMADAGKPIGAICISPVILAKSLGSRKPSITIGNDSGTAQAIETMGGSHVDKPVDDIVVDEKLKLVTTPAYMVGPSIKHVAAGIEKLVEKVLALI